MHVGKRLAHACHEESLGGILSAVTVRGSHQLLVLRHQHTAEELRPDVPQRPAQPDIEEIREIGIADVVVVGRIGGNYGSFQGTCSTGSVLLNDLRGRCKCRRGMQHLDHIVQAGTKISSSASE